MRVKTTSQVELGSPSISYFTIHSLSLESSRHPFKKWEWALRITLCSYKKATKTVGCQGYQITYKSSDGNFSLFLFAIICILPRAYTKCRETESSAEFPLLFAPLAVMFMCFQEHTPEWEGELLWGGERHIEAQKWRRKKSYFCCFYILKILMKCNSKQSKPEIYKIIVSLLPHSLSYIFYKNFY